MSERQRVILLVGLPASGKSAWVRNAGVQAISSDHIREILADDEADQTIHSNVFATARYLLRRRLAIGRPVTYIDATNLTRRDRRPFVALAKERGCSAEALVFDTPLAVCLSRNSSRQRKVPEHAIYLMAARLIPPSVEEGFEKITWIAHAAPAA